MGSSFTPELIRLLSAAGCRFERHGKGDHDIWFSPVTGLCFPVDGKIKSRHTANAVLKQASRLTQTLLSQHLQAVCFDNRKQL